ncbi:MAG: DedA family protein [Ktedonobacterales bacterium]|nr:DedA family protein [Ktedonobacterales bacterium]
MDQLLASLTQIPPLAVYGFVLVWLAAESAGVPLPNEVVLLLAGSLAAKGEVSAPVLVVVATLASLLGASIAYTIGLRGGRAAVMRFGRYIRLDEQRLDAIEVWFARAGVFAILIARITPFVRTVASYPAGMLRMPRRTFVLATLAGSLVWCTVMVTLGDLLGNNYTAALKLIEKYTVPAVAVVAVLIVAYLWLHNRLKHAQPRGLTEAGVRAIHEREERP